MLYKKLKMSLLCVPLFYQICPPASQFSSVCLFLFLSLYVSLSVPLSLCLSLCSSLSVSLSPFVSMSLDVYHTLLLTLYLYLSIYLSIYLSTILISRSTYILFLYRPVTGGHFGPSSREFLVHYSILLSPLFYIARREH